MIATAATNAATNLLCLWLATLGGDQFEVVALSIDRSGVATVQKFYSDVGVRNLALHVDRSGKVVRELGAIGLPATILIDRQGREMGRLMGPAEWDEPEIVEFLKRVIAEGKRGRGQDPATGSLHRLRMRGLFGAHPTISSADT